MNGFICLTPIYKYEGWIFEYGHTGCWPLRKNFEPRKRAGRKFYSMLKAFMDLPEDEQKTYRVGGGCIEF